MRDVGKTQGTEINPVTADGRKRKWEIYYHRKLSKLNPKSNSQNIQRINQFRTKSQYSPQNWGNWEELEKYS